MMLGSKKMLAALSTLILLLALSAGAAFAETTAKGTITGDTVNVRVKPDVSSKIVVQLSKGTVVTVTSNEEDWCKISCNDASGWVSRQFITVSEAVIGKGTIKGDSVNVRSKADVSSDAIAKLDKGTRVDVTRKAGEWYRIAIGDNRYGWVNKDYLAYKDDTTSRGVKDEISAPVSADKQVSDADEESNVEDNEAVDQDEPAADDKDIRQQIVAYAKKFLGVRYVYGGSSPKGFDCSGFVQYVFKHFDIKLDRSSTDQALNGTKVKKSELKPGDTVYFDTNGGHNAIEHAGIYIGDGKFIHASSGRSTHRVVISDINDGFYDDCYMWARRVIED